MPEVKPEMSDQSTGTPNAVPPQSEFETKGGGAEILDRIPCVLVRRNSAGEVTFVNQLGLEIFGLQDGRSRSAAFQALASELGGADPEIVRPDVAASTAPYRRRNVVHHKRADGTSLWLCWTSLHTSRGDGAPAETLSVGIEMAGMCRAADGQLTALENAEFALRRAEQQYAGLVETLHQVTWTMDGVGRLTYISPSVEPLFRVRLDGVFSHRWRRMLTPASIRTIRRVFLDRGRSKRRGQPPSAEVSPFEVEYQRADGTTIWLEVRMRELFEAEGGTVNGYVGTTRDISRQKQAAVELASREASLRQAMALAKMGTWRAGADGSLTWSNEVCRFFGYEPTEVKVDRGFFLRHLVIEDLPRVVEALDRSFKLGAPYSIDYRYYDAANNLRYGRDVGESERDAQGVVLGLNGYFQDVTEQRQNEDLRQKLEAQVQQAQKLESLGVLAGGIAHDFNNLLTSILGNADLALSELSPLSPARGHLEDIEKTSRRAADLCRQMLAYSGKGRFVVQPVDLNKLVEEMTHLLSISISKKAVMKFNFYKELPTIMADAAQMRQVVMNLIVNASEAIGDKSGVIAVTTGAMDCDAPYLATTFAGQTAEPGQYGYIEVSDTGSGMDQATIARIFDPFFTTKFTGRGLGLAAVLGIIRGHRGAIKVYSELGKGSTFKVLFPAHEPAVDHGSAGKTVEWRGSGAVLIADDEETIRSVARRMLEKSGFEVLAAADGREAVEIFRIHHGRVRLVVLDMTMPHLDGEACFRELRRIDPRVKVIMTSGYNEQDVISRFTGKGLAGFVQKPFRTADLLECVRATLSG